MTGKNGNLTNFLYDDDSLSFFVPLNNFKLSRFDKLLQAKWNAALDANVFNYQLNIQNEKFLPGDYQFFVQLNVERGELRRLPGKYESCNEAFDPNKFNFTKIKTAEKLFYISYVENAEVDSSTICDRLELGKDLIAINTSPIEYGHILLLPWVDSGLPQRVTSSSLHAAMELCLLSETPDFRVGFNSLCASASVNHLHFHGYYLKQRMLLETIQVERVAGFCHKLVNFPCKGFVFQIQCEKEFLDVNVAIFRLVTLLQERDIAHNIMITRGISFDISPLVDFRNCIRIYIFARKSALGEKSVMEINPAVCEFFGHLCVKSLNDYENLTEESIANELRDYTEPVFESLLPHVYEMFSDPAAQE